jgi:hypothetical protein
MSIIENSVVLLNFICNFYSAWMGRERKEIVTGDMVETQAHYSKAVRVFSIWHVGIELRGGSKTSKDQT